MSSGDRLTRRIPYPAIARRVSDMMFKAWAKALHRSSELPITVRGARTATSELKFTVWRGEKVQQNSFCGANLRGRVTTAGTRNHRARHITQSAMKIFVSCGFASCRFDAQTIFFPLALNIGKPSKVGAVVTCSRADP